MSLDSSLDLCEHGRGGGFSPAPIHLELIMSAQLINNLGTRKDPRNKRRSAATTRGVFIGNRRIPEAKAMALIPAAYVRHKRQIDSFIKAGVLTLRFSSKAYEAEFWALVNEIGPSRSPSEDTALDDILDQAGLDQPAEPTEPASEPELEVIMDTAADETQVDEVVVDYVDLDVGANIEAVEESMDDPEPEDVEVHEKSDESKGHEKSHAKPGRKGRKSSSKGV